MKKSLTIILLIFSFSAFSQTSFEHYAKASGLYLEGNYKDAAVYYSKALEMEKKKRTFDKDNFYVLIDNLSISYGITGDLQKAIKTLEYGLTIDTKYPMFYYNLACSYAEQENIDKTVEYLELAIKYRDNMLRDEQFPNPAEDDSFKRFLNNDKFKKVMKQYEATSKK